MDLFSYAEQAEAESKAPLAYRMRPRTLDEMVGQDEIIGPESLLRRAIEADRLMSVLFYGPPGTGKTTLAKVIAGATQARFETLNAVSAGISDIRQVIQLAKDEQSMYGRRTVLFIDEIHRFNKSQQDALLPHVESGLVIMIGATTENPYFEVNPALVSRSHIYRLDPLTNQQLREILKRALQDEKRGLGRTHARVTEAAFSVFERFAGGDARRALNALEQAVLVANLDDTGQPLVDEAQALASLQAHKIVYDKSGDAHYDTISAFIKSVRGSNPDAALLWLAKMLVAGEDPVFIARRLIILASEDIGNACPEALGIAVSGLEAVRAIGMPEGRIILGQVTSYLATCPKSNASYVAINQAISDVESGISLQVPLHLRSTSYASASKLGHGVGYLYPHDYPNHVVEQNYWPVDEKPRLYYKKP